MRILFIGAINLFHVPLGGEEYKNQLIFERSKNFDILKSFVDTHNWKKNPGVLVILLYKLFFFRWDGILLSASSSSVYRLLILVKWLNPSLLKKISYLVVGGYFPEGIKTSHFNWLNYKELKNIIVQGEIIKQQLLECSELKNIQVVPNFKKFENHSFINNRVESTFKFVFIGRISKSKGIVEIIEAVNILKNQNPKLDFSVDFYGPVDEEIEFPIDLPLKYMGYLDIMNKQIESYSKLAEYSCMLFPTFWKGEGFPGVIIDAYIVGLPVIVTDWNMNKEVVEFGETGLIIPIKDSNALYIAMMEMMQNPNMVKKMSERSLKKAKDYHIDNVWPKIEKLIFN